MMIPVVCETCHHIAHLARKPFGWLTYCRFCNVASAKYDDIILGKEEQR